MSTPINQIRNNSQQPQQNMPNQPLIPPIYNPNANVEIAAQNQLPGQNLTNVSDPMASNQPHNQLVSDILNEMNDEPGMGEVDDTNVSNFNYATDNVNIPPQRNTNNANNLKSEETFIVDSQDGSLKNNETLGSMKNIDLLNKIDMDDDENNVSMTQKIITKVKPLIIVFIIFIVLSLHQVNRLLFSFFPKLLHENGQLTLYAIILRATIASLLFFILDTLM